MKQKPIKLGIRIALGFVLPVAILVVWYLSGKLQWANQAILPTLYNTCRTAKTLITDGTLAENILVSMGRVLKGFLLGASLGIVIGIAMGLSRVCYSLLQSIVGIFRPIPMIAWIPLFILWIGIGDELKVAVIALGCFWSVLLNTIHGIQSVDPKLLEVATALEKNKWIVLRQIVLPSALPSVITGIRLGMGSAWACVVAAEMIAASKGIGYMIMFAREMAQPAKLMVGIFSIGLVGLLIDSIILKLQKSVIRW